MKRNYDDYAVPAGIALFLLCLYLAALAVGNT